MNTGQALKECKKILDNAQIEDSRFEAGCLIEKVLGCNRLALITHKEDEVSQDKLNELLALAQRRAAKEPLQYILGLWSFCGFDFYVGEGVLIPRDDTEVIVSLCLEYLQNSQSKRVIDLCAGSGAISIALEKLINAEVTAVELSDTAYEYLSKNIEFNKTNTKMYKGNIFSCHTDFKDNSCDLIVSNPPYIKSEEIPSLQSEVQREPKMALDGGADGLDFYRTIIKYWSSKLKKGGALALELGENQAEYVAELMKLNDFANIKTALDFGNTQRAIIGIYKA
jgi:release factor glutamine methyltransferase